MAAPSGVRMSRVRIVGRIVLGWVGGADVGRASIRIDAATGERAERTVGPHPDCGCRGVGELFDHAPESDEPQMRRLRLAPS